MRPLLRLARHRDDRAVRAPAAAPDRAAASVEQAEVDAVLAAHAAERLLRLVQRPVRHPVAAVLVAVRVAEHDLLEAAARVELERGRPDRRTAPPCDRPASARSSIVSKSGTKSSVVSTDAVVAHAPEPGLLREQHRLEHVAHRVRHADDVAPIAPGARRADLADHRERLERSRATSSEARRRRHAAGAACAARRCSSVDLRGFVERGVVVGDAGRGEHAGDRLLVHRGCAGARRARRGGGRRCARGRARAASRPSRAIAP